MGRFTTPPYSTRGSPTTTPPRFVATASSSPTLSTTFFFSCPLRFAVWQECWRLLFDVTSPSWYSIKSALVTQSWPDLHEPLTLNPPSLLASAIIVGLWRAHWASVFDSSPFIPQKVVASIHRNIISINRESSLFPPT
ncbi:hypothetical protein DM01DRAFT_1290236 [Hesseltinella vesiculosa]|uniref:Uncharacterized protein n=1 Tax=Hesseltinella vesiculosa TaxID=101127 RepID=A0A1X2GD22_9FUNG|nr:hypothetical protein DM01DRAFT_1290236 [Hesseltinella vesiculosa]